MKKVKLLFILFIVLCCTGCDSNSSVTRDLRHSGFSLSKDPFSCDALIPKSNKEYEAIQYLGANYAITTTGVIYELSFGQLFSNGEYCKKADTNLTAQAVIGDEIFKGSDNKAYYLSNSSAPAYSEVLNSDPNLSAYMYFFNNQDVVKVQNVGDSKYYVLKKDGDVYSYTVVKNNSNGVHSPGNPTKVYTKDAYGGAILDFNYAGDSSEATFIRTETAIYRNAALNREDCQKYVDVQCQYQFQKDELLTAHMDRIMAYNGNMLITDYLKVFTLGGSSN